MNIDDLIKTLVRTYDTSGKGRKFCPSCEKYVAARTLNCACGFEFTQGTKHAPAEPKTDYQLELEKFIKAIPYKHYKIIHTPRGACPFVLKHKTEIGVEEWCENIVASAKQEKVFYSPPAFKYWLRQFTNVNSPEYKKLSKFIDNWVKLYLE